VMFGWPVVVAALLGSRRRNWLHLALIACLALSATRTGDFLAEDPRCTYQPHLADAVAG